MLLLRGTDPHRHLSTTDPVEKAAIGAIARRTRELRQQELDYLASRIAHAINGSGGDAAAPPNADPP
ncbi:MAG: hypothetical protein AB7G37_00950 [Solirubrobacteraceae bacterium]